LLIGAVERHDFLVVGCQLSVVGKDYNNGLPGGGIVLLFVVYCLLFAGMGGSIAELPDC
jgi:hypothetical protein